MGVALQQSQMDTKLANDFKMKQQFKKVKKHSLGEMMDVDHAKCGPI